MNWQGQVLGMFVFGAMALKALLPFTPHCVVWPAIMCTTVEIEIEIHELGYLRL